MKLHPMVPGTQGLPEMVGARPSPRGQQQPEANRLTLPELKAEGNDKALSLLLCTAVLLQGVELIFSISFLYFLNCL